MFRACFVGACVVGAWSRDPVRTVAERGELHVFYECFVIAHAIGSANANVIVNANAGASANMNPNERKYECEGECECECECECEV